MTSFRSASCEKQPSLDGQMLPFGRLLRSMQIRDTAGIFTARTWPGRYMRPLAVSLGSKSSRKYWNGRDLSKKGSVPRRSAYAERTAMKAIILSAH